MNFALEQIVELLLTIANFHNILCLFVPTAEKLLLLDRTIK